MFFIFSKVLDFLLQPILWVIIFLLLGFVLKNARRKKLFLYSGLGLLLFFTNPFVINEAWRAWERPPVPLKDVPVYDAGILLTGITSGNKSPHDRVYFDKGADRLLHTLLLFKRGNIKKIVISGGSGSLSQRYATEAEELRKMLLLSAVPDSAILVEEKSRNTRENAKYTQMLLTLHPELKKLVLITSAFHMRRAEGCFRKAGLQTDIFPADFYGGDRSFNPAHLVIPSERALMDWNRLLHEMVGFIMYKVMGYC